MISIDDSIVFLLGSTILEIITIRWYHRLCIVDFKSYCTNIKSNDSTLGGVILIVFNNKIYYSIIITIIVISFWTTSMVLRDYFSYLCAQEIICSAQDELVSAICKESVLTPLQSHIQQFHYLKI